MYVVCVCVFVCVYIPEGSIKEEKAYSCGMQKKGWKRCWCGGWWWLLCIGFDVASPGAVVQPTQAK